METVVVNLSLGVEEEDTLQLGAESMEKEFTYDHCFVGCFLTSSVVNVQAMRSTLANVWHLIGGVFIVDLEDGRFLFQFYLEVDAERIVRDGPWTFNSHILILHELRDGENPMIIELFLVDVWVLIHDISFGFMLKRRKKFPLPNGASAYTRIKYEKLSLFCFLCGKLGHGESFCPLRATIPKQDVVFQWDLSLHAPPRKVAIWKSKWLVEDGNGDGTKLGNFSNIAGEIRGDSYKSFPMNHGLMGGMLSNATHNNLVSDQVVSSAGGPEIGLHVNTMVETMDEEMGDRKMEDIPINQIEGYKRPQTKVTFLEGDFQIARKKLGN
ncbi:hypothetical protein Gogos_018042 [Gossypium gossypioides]|uniref:CCHC-type domain-containing protein n=1 Tax=Gossypium gossypioides TaxID=34282 RepID=A0A7J9BER0_GOSGO|nr:hypothetical protein [Gossypium gossypioides]